jgi:NAD(P)-dependent dehydrogenase (short-subunit alcohol dehydrogenase family)
MSRLLGKKIAVVGASRGIGRAIALTCAEEGSTVLAVARGATGLRELARENPSIATLALDAGENRAPATVFATMRPDVLVVSAGALPPVSPFHELSWAQFAVNWDADVKISFEFCKKALVQPLPPGSMVILISSGVAMGGSPISGGYAGAKRMQMFLAQYAQRESDRLKLGLRFLALAPARIMPETDLGRYAVDGYSAYLGIPPEDFIKSLSSGQSVADVARAVVSLAEAPLARTETALMASSSGLAAVGTP